MPVRTLLAALLVATTLSACSRDPQAASQKHVEGGDRYTAQGKHAEAIIEYRNAVQEVPRSGTARVKLAEAYLKVGDGAHALEEYVRAADLLPDDAAVQLKASGLLLLAGRFDDAKLWTEKVLARDAGNLQAQILLANALAGLKDFDAAVSELEEAIKLNPNRGETYSNLGAIELGRGQKVAAERAFTKAVELDGKSTDARLALANFYWADARWNDAERELKAVVEIDPNNVLAHRALASFYVATNHAVEAEPHLKKVSELTKTPGAAFALADYYVRQNNETSARSELQSLADNAQTSAPAEVRLAVLDRKNGKKEGAYQRLTRVLEKDQTNLEALLMRTVFLMDDGRIDEALSSATLAVEKHQSSTAALFTLGSVQAARRQVAAAVAAYEGVLRLNPRATDAKVALARLQLSAGRPDLSTGLAQEALASQPQNTAARLALVRGLLAQRDTARAKTELESLTKQFPDAAAVHVLNGLLKGSQRDEAGARKHFARALELEPDSTEALGGLVALDLSGGRRAEARARVDERLARSPSEPAVLLLGARTYAATGDPKKAEELLRRVIQADATRLEAYTMLAQLYISQRRLDAALAEFENLATKDPKPVAALTFAGIILQSQGKTTEARARFERALQFDPEAAVAANNLAWMHAESGDDLDAALQLAQTAFRKLPDTAEVGDTLGYVYYKKDLQPLAIQTLKPIVEKNPTNPVYHYHLGMVYAKTGDIAQARLHLTRALELKPDFAGAKDAKALLDSLASR